MKKKLSLLFTLLTLCSSWVWAATWESLSGWTKSDGGQTSASWFGIHTPGTTSNVYSLAQIQLHQLTGYGNNDNYVAIARVKPNSSKIRENDVIAVSTNHVSPATADPGQLETYTFSTFQLVGGTTYYLMFLSSNSPSDGYYSVRSGRIALNTNTGTYGNYPYGGDCGNNWPYYKAELTDVEATVGSITYQYKFNGNVVSSETIGNLLAGYKFPYSAPAGYKSTMPSGTITVADFGTTKDIAVDWTAFKYAESFDDITHWYKLRMHTSYNNQYVYNNSGNARIATSIPAANQFDYYWGFVGNPIDGFQLYCLGAGKEVALDNNDPCTVSASGKSVNFKVANGDPGTYGNSAEAYFTLYVTPGNYLNHRSDGTIKRWGAANTGSTFMVDEATPISITDLSSLSNNKSYLITNQRATWQFANNASSMTAFSKANGIKYLSPTQQIAILNKSDKYYLYSVNAQKFLTASNTLTEVPTSNEQVSITSTGNATYPWFFKFTNVSNRNINVDGNSSVVINNWSTIDNGNSNSIIETVDFDPKDALAMFDRVAVEGVTYKLTCNGNEISSKTVTLRDYVGHTPTGEFAWGEGALPDYCSYGTPSPAKITAETTEVSIPLVWNGPFTISDSYANAIWFYVNIGGGWLSYNSTGTPYPFTNEVQKNDDGLWAFIGNPIDGFKIASKGKGEESNLGWYYPPYSGTDANCNYKWKIVQGTEGAEIQYGGYYLFNRNSTLALSNSEGTDKRTLTARSYYCQQALDDFADFVGESTDKYFGVKSSSITTVNSMIETLPKMTEAQYTEYFTDLYNSFKSYIIFNWPESGYYRIKNNNSGNYIGYGKPEGLTGGQVEKTAGLVVITSANKATDYSTVVRLTKVSASLNTGVYTISTQGMNVQGTPTANSVYTVSDGDPVQYKFVVDGTPEIVYIKDSNASGSGDATEGCFHEADWTETHTLNGIVPWTHDAAPSQWTIEDATSITLTLNAVGDKTYGTTYLPFDVTLPAEGDVCAYTLTDNGNGWLHLNLLGEDGKSIPAGTPVLLRGTSTTSVTATIADVDEDDIDTGENVLSGTYFTMDHGDNLVLGKIDGVPGFYKYSFDIKPNKAYISTSAGAKAYKFMLDDEDATAIANVNVNGNNAAIYNIAGQRISKLQKGINIVNGKKVLY